MGRRAWKDSVWIYPCLILFKKPTILIWSKLFNDEAEGDTKAECGFDETLTESGTISCAFDPRFPSSEELEELDSESFRSLRFILRFSCDDDG